MQDSKKKSLVKVTPKKEMKAPRRGSKSVLRMADRKQKRFEMKEYNSKGENHFFIVKKKNTEETPKDAVEDIYADWRNNFCKIKRPRAQPRVRKLSHRQERKELLKQDEEMVLIGPHTYSQMLKKGLRLPKEQEMVEDIFECWRMYIDELGSLVAEKKEGTVEDVDFFKVWKHNLHVPVEGQDDLDILASTNHGLLPSLDCGQPTVKNVKARKALNPPKPLKKTVEMNEKATQSSPPPPSRGWKKPYEPVKKNMQIVPFVEKKLLLLPVAIPLPDLSSPLKPKMINFKPSEHSKRLINKDVGLVRKTPTPLTAQQIYEFAKESAITPSWQSMICSIPETSGRGEKRKSSTLPEQVFQSWIHIFSEQKIATAQLEPEAIFQDWAAINLRESADSKDKVRSVIESDAESKVTKKEARKMVKSENIDEDIIEVKENRRNDFTKNAQIKDKKRSDASRKSNGKKIK